MAEKTLFCFGYGFSARCLAARLRKKGWKIATTARSPEKVTALRDEGIDAHLWPISSLAEVWGEKVHVLVSAAPDENGDPVLALHREELIALSDRVAWLGYLSTTAVYGNRDGGEVDETSELRPASARGARRVEAEKDWLALAPAVPAHVFRLAGIYGPGRGPLEKVQAPNAKRVIKAGQVFGRIHIEDIANTCEASMARPNPGAAYNVTDDFTCPPQEVLEYAADLLGIPHPPEVDFDTADMSPMARSFYGENKRVVNDKIKRDLGVKLNYPTYREGLAADLASTRRGSSTRG